MEGIKVYVRVRPLLVSNNELYDGKNRKIVTYVSKCKKEISVDATSRQVSCRYDRVFGSDSTQAEVYEHVKSSVQATLKGINSTIFAYGQTSSGKTYTMFGKESCIFDEPGIVPRCISDIFRFSAQNHRHVHSFSVLVSFMQVYNEQVYDMLDDAERMNPLAIHETPQKSNSQQQQRGHISVSGLTEYQVHSYDQCLAVVELGLKNRAIRETRMNHASSRSHSILQIGIEQKSFDEITGWRVLQSKLNLVDLAGSERWTTSGARGKGMGEGQISELTNINSSLYTLGRCVAALAKMSREDKSTTLRSPSTSKHIHIPYRDSKLTRMLQDSLGGNSKTYLVATINPSLACSDESISTLRFADRAHQVMTHAQVNEEITENQSEVKALRQEILRLQNLLKHHGIQHGEAPPTSYGNNIKLNNRWDGDYDDDDHDNDDDDDNGGEEEESTFTRTVSNDEEEQIHQPRLESLGDNDEVGADDSYGLISAVKDASVTHIHRITCEKIINALSSIMITVDSFLKTIHRSPNSSMQKVSPDQSSLNKLSHSVNQFEYNLKHQLLRGDGFTSSNNKQSRVLGDEVQNEVLHTRNGKSERKDKYVTSPTPPIYTTRNSKPTKSRSSLSSLLHKRNQLQGVGLEEKKDIKLRDELKKARKQKEQKQQLRQWLLEKEMKAENPFNC